MRWAGDQTAFVIDDADARIVRTYFCEKQLYRVTDAPTFKRPAYMVYSTNPETVQLTRQGLVHIASQESER
jgi:hypothetical protein